MGLQERLNGRIMSIYCVSVNQEMHAKCDGRRRMWREATITRALESYFVPCECDCHKPKPQASERMDVMGWMNPHGERMDVTALGKGEFAAWVDNHYMGCFYELVTHRQILTDGFNVIPVDASRMAALTLLDARVTAAQQKRPTPEQVAAYQYGEWPGER